MERLLAASTVECDNSKPDMVDYAVNSNVNNNGEDSIMGFSFGLAYKPAYQRRRGKCAVCKQGILAGEKIMLGTGFFNGIVIAMHIHYEPCFTEALVERAKTWFFLHDYHPKVMAPELAAKLNRLRAKRYYIKKKGGAEWFNQVMDIERQIAEAKDTDKNKN